MILRKVLVASLMLVLAGISSLAQNPFIHNYTTFDGLPSNAIYQVYQDSRKFIWFVSDAGVSRFDGSNFINFSKKDGLHCNDVVHIKEDRLGRIWFFNMDATMNFYKDGVIYNETTAPFLDSLVSVEFFRDFYEDSNHTLYFYFNHQREVFSLDTLNQVRKYKLPSFIMLDLLSKNIIDGMDIRFMNQGIDGFFYLRAVAGLFKMADFSGTPILVDNSIFYKAVFYDPAKGMYIVKSNTSGSKTEIRKMKPDFSFDQSAPLIYTNTNYVSFVMEDDNGYLWVSTYDEGVYCYKGDQLVRHFDIKQAQAVIQDHEKNIWISSLKDGVYKISPYLNQHLHYECSLFDGKGVNAIAPYDRGGIWLTDGGKIFLLMDGRIFRLNHQNPEGNLNQLLQIDENTIVVGEISTNFYAIEGIRPDPSTLTIPYNTIITAPRPFKRLTLNHDRTEITSWNFFTVLKLQPRLFDHIQHLNINERIFNSFYDARGELVVNANRMYLFKGDSLAPYNDLSIFDNRIISDHLIIDDTVDVFNVEGDSIFIKTDHNTWNLTAKWGYPLSLHIKSMDYSNPILYLATSKDIYYCIKPEAGAMNRECELYKLDISFRNIHDILVDDGKLYIASDDGLTAISATSFTNLDAVPPIPYFKLVEVNDLPDNDAHATTVTGRSRILMDFSSINYSFSPVIYSYKLLGLDNEWQQATSTNVVYENLPRGQYTFLLKARKPTSEWSDPITYQINIKATIWQRPIFYLALIIIVAGLFNLYMINRKNAEIKRWDMEHQLVVMEQRALQSMMNPHFIFNSLGSIQNYLLQSKPKEAGLYLSQFARLIRQNINASNSNMINLEEEVDRLKNYLDLERMRMENKFEYKIEIDESIDAEEALIPSMLIQPFVENSIWHGISHVEKNGKIVISFLLNDERSMKIVVEDNGVGMKKAEARTTKSEKHLGMGMAITRKRLDLLGDKFKVSTNINISETEPGSANPGTRVEIIVPFTYEGEEGERS